MLKLTKKEIKRYFWAHIFILTIAELLLVIGAVMVGYSFLQESFFSQNSFGIIGISCIFVSVMFRVLGEIIKKEII